MKKFMNREEFEKWYSSKAREMRKEYERAHPEYDFWDIMVEHSDEWGIQSEEHCKALAAADGYDLSGGAPLSE